jgi:hypothetical protein
MLGPSTHMRHMDSLAYNTWDTIRICPWQKARLTTLSPPTVKLCPSASTWIWIPGRVMVDVHAVEQLRSAHDGSRLFPVLVLSLCASCLHVLISPYHTCASALSLSLTPRLPLSLARSLSHAEVARMRNKLAEEEERNNSARARQIREVLSACALVSEGIQVRSE